MKLSSHINFSFIISVIYIFLSCSDANIKNEALQNYLIAPDVTEKNVYEIRLDSILNVSIGILGVYRYVRPTIYQDRYFYAIIDEEYPYIIKIDLIKKKYISIKLPQEVFAKEKINTLLIHSSDSIFIQNSNSPAIFLINDKGDLIDKWDTKQIINTFPNKKKYSFIFPYFLPFYKPTYQAHSGYMFTTPLPIKFVDSLGFENTSLHGIFSLKDRKWVRLYSPPEGVMKHKGRNAYPYDVSVPYNLVIGNKSYVSYPMEHYVYVYDVRTGKLIDKKPVCSSQVKQFPSPMPLSHYSDMQAVRNYRIQYPFYEPLFYHQKLKIFSRTVHFPQPLKTIDGKLNNGTSRMALVIILDEALNVIGENIFKEGSYPIHGAIPLSDGLLLSSHYTGNDTILRHKYKYTFIKK